MSKLRFSLQPETGRLSERDTKRYFSTFGIAAAVLMLAYYGSNYVFSLALALFAPEWMIESAWLGNLLSFFTLYGIGFPCFLLVLLHLPRDTTPKAKMGGKSFWAGLCVAIALMSIGSYLSEFINSYFASMTGGIPISNPVETMTSQQSILVDLIFVAILAPIFEELVFRKVVCDRLLPLGEGYAVVLSAVLFGLVHGNFFQFFYAAAVGALFALIYVKTGRLRYSISYHIIINLLGGVIAPWLVERIMPWATEEGIMELTELAETDPAALFHIWQVYLLPVMLYESVFLVAAVFGVVFLVKGRKRIHFLEGLLPPPKEHRVSTVFCSAGIAAAIAVFAGVFLLSLIGG